MPFYEKCKGIERLPKKELCRGIMACQNNDLLNEMGHFYLKILEAYVTLALYIPMNDTKKCLSNELGIYGFITRIFVGNFLKAFWYFGILLIFLFYNNIIVALFILSTKTLYL